MKKIFSLLLTIIMWQIMYGQAGVGIGTTDPHAPLQFANQLADRKIVLFENANNNRQFFGFGVNYGALNYQVADVTNDHVFKSSFDSTYSLELMRITGWGLIGMGTSLPHNRLDVDYGGGRTGVHPWYRPLYVTGDLLEDSGIEFRHSNASQGIGFGFNTIYATGNDLNQPLKFASRGYAPLVFKTNSLERMIISPDGNVGIGTNPTAQLQLANSVQNRKIVLYDNSGNDFEFFGLGVSGEGLFRYHVSSTINDHVFFAGNSDSTANELMRIKGTGLVGIGVNAPQNRLDLHYDGFPRSGTHSTGNTLYVTGDFSAGHGVQFRQTDGTQGIGFGGHTIYANGSNTDQDLNLASKGPNGILQFATNGYERVRITGSGNVGINIGNPHAPLQFANIAQNRKIVLYENADNDHEFFGLGINGDGSLRFQTPGSGNDFVFFNGINSTSSNEIFRIKGNGLMGLGVAAPLNKLDINYGPARTGTHPSGLAGYITADLLPAGNGIEIRHYNSTQGIGFGSNTMYAAGTNASQDLNIAAKGTAGNVILKTNALNRVVVTGSGNVGIGTDTPHGKLQFAQDLAPRKIVFAEAADDDHQFLGFGFDANACIRYQVSNTSVGHVFYAGTSATTDKELMRIMGSGNVGINMTSVLNRLDINNGAAARTGTHATGLAAYITGDFGASSNGVEFRHNDGAQGIGFGYNTIYAAGSNAIQDLNLAAKGATGNLSISTNGTERLKINGSGNIGLGVTSPLNKLDIHNGTTRSGTHNSGQALYVTGGGEFRSADATTGLGIGSNNIFATGSNAIVDLSLAAKGAGNIIFNSNGVERVRINSIGRIGIGTNAPNAPIHMNAGTANRMIVLFETANDNHQFYGFGVNGNVLRYQTDQSASDHVFYSAIDANNSKELMRIKGNGNVGIGITAPVNKLDIAGAARSGTHNSGQALYVTGGSEFRSADATTGLGIGSNDIFATGSNAIVDLSLAAKGSTGNVVLKTNALDRMIVAGSGNVGMGVATPLNKLDISYGPARTTNNHPTGLAAYITSDLSANQNVEIRNYDASQGVGIGIGSIYATGSNINHNLSINAKGPSGVLSLNTGFAERMRITGNGFIGFGVTNPLNILDVHNGPARTNVHGGGQALYVTGGGEFRSADATTGLVIGSNNITASGSNANVDISLAAKGASGNFIFNGNGVERFRITSLGKIGINTSSPNAPIHLNAGTANRMIILSETANNNHQFYGFGVNSFSLRYQTDQAASDHVFYSAIDANNSKELMRIKGTGDVNIANGKLQFGQSLVNRKIVLWESANNDHEYFGFGVNDDGTLRYQTASTYNDHVFYSASSSSSSTEIMRLTGFGSLSTLADITAGGNLTVNGIITTDAFTEPALSNGFTNFPGYATAAYYKDKMGIVHLRGLVQKNTSHNGLVIFTLPAGYRPSTSGRLLFSAQANSGMSRIDILADGSVMVMAGSTGWLGLDGISFRAD